MSRPPVCRFIYPEPQSALRDTMVLGAWSLVTDRPGFKSQLCPLCPILAVLLRCLPLNWLCMLICKMEIIVPTSTRLSLRFLPVLKLPDSESSSQKGGLFLSKMKGNFNVRGLLGSRNSTVKTPLPLYDSSQLSFPSVVSFIWSLLWTECLRVLPCSIYMLKSNPLCDDICRW